MSPHTQGACGILRRRARYASYVPSLDFSHREFRLLALLLVPTIHQHEIHDTNIEKLRLSANMHISEIRSTPVR